MDREDQGASESGSDDDWTADAEGGGLRGWISPDDRLWRHPSESGSVPNGGEPSPTTLDSAPHKHAGTWILAAAAACLVLALVATGLMITTTGGSDDDGGANLPNRGLDSAPTTEPGVGGVSGRSAIAAMVAPVEHSTVALEVTGARGAWVGAGLVAESGGIVVTAARALAGARSITVIEADGTRWPATLVGTDQDSGLSVVRIADDLPAANPAAGDPVTGASVVAMALDPAHRAGAAPTTSVYAGLVIPTTRAPAGGLTAISVSAPLTSDDIGCPLVNGGGQVSGLLEAVDRSGRSVVSVFVPAQLVFGVTEQLVAAGQVEHGWLGVDTSDASAATATTSTDVGGAPVDTTEGARLDAVDPGGPAAQGGMEAGDVITAVDGVRVRSAADLLTELYSDPPGTTVEFEYVRQGMGTAYTAVTLAAADPDAPVLSSSP